MSEVLIQSLIGAGGMLLSVIIATLINAIFSKYGHKAKKHTEVDSKGNDIPCKVDSKVLKNAPVTVNTDKLIELIEDAEAHENFSAFEKLDYVLTSYQQYCMDSNFKFVKEVITDSINKLIAMTKKVNKRDKDIEAEKAEDPDEVQLNIK